MARESTAQACATPWRDDQGAGPAAGAAGPGPAAAGPLGLAPGTVVDGRYRVEARIASGGTATVYRAVQLSLGRPVALKVLRPDPAAEPGAAAAAVSARRFALEARLAAGLRHPHAVAVLDCGAPADGQPYLAMELLEGATLAATLAAHGALGPARAAHLAAQLVAVLAALHRLGACHRDLKPGNVMLLAPPAAPDFVKLLDFGLARGLDPSAPGLTRPGALLGSPCYMSPEQVQGLPPTAASDVYGVGLLLYEATTGAAAFARATAVETMMAQVDAPPPPLPTGGPAAASPALAAVVARCLAKRPQDRFADMAALAAALSGAAATAAPCWDVRRPGAEEPTFLGVPPAAPPPGPETAAGARGAPAPRRADAAADVPAPPSPRGRDAAARAPAPPSRLPSAALALPARPSVARPQQLGAPAWAALASARPLWPRPRDAGSRAELAPLAPGGPAAAGDVAAVPPPRWARRRARLAAALGVLLLAVPALVDWRGARRPPSVGRSAASVRLHLDSAPQGAEVFLDDALLCRHTPCILHLRGEAASPGRLLRLRFVQRPYDDYLATRVVAGRDLRVRAPLATAGT